MGRRRISLLPGSRRGRMGVALLSSAMLAIGLSAATASAAPKTPQPDVPGTADVRVLVFHGPAAQQDDPVLAATNAIEDLGKSSHFTVDEADNPSVFTVENLARYRGVV